MTYLEMDVIFSRFLLFLKYSPHPMIAGLFCFCFLFVCLFARLFAFVAVLFCFGCVCLFCLFVCLFVFVLFLFLVLFCFVF